MSLVNIKYNIPLMYIIACLMWARFFIPVLALFYIASQVPLEQFAIIMGAFALSNFLLEIPTGVIADLIGKKKTLMVGRFCYIIEVAILAFMNGFWPFLIAKIISGVGVSFVSGATEAMFYDTLKKLGREKEHKRISGTMFMLTSISMAFVFIIGAYIFSFNPKWPAVLSLPFIIIGFALTCLLCEPYKSRKKVTLRNSFLHLKSGLVFVWKNKIVKYLILSSMVVFALLDIAVSNSSAYFEVIAIPVSFIGVIAFVASMITAVVSKNAYKFENRLGDKKTLQLIEVFLIAGFLLSSFLVPYYGVIIYFLFPVVTGLFHLLINHYINVHIDTAHRATIISIKHLCDQFITFIAYNLFGYLIKTSSMSTAYFYFGVFLLFYSLLLFGHSIRFKTGELNNSKVKH